MKHEYFDRPLPLVKQPLTDLQRKWLLALESGNYEQGKPWTLKSDTGYCCLGVANEACNLGESDVDELTNTYGTLGLISPGGAPDRASDDDFHKYPSLTAMNDGMYNRRTSYHIREGGNGKHRHSFARIAAHIRNNPDQYFVPEANYASI